MKPHEVVFACLNCAADTGCANRLVCEKCRTGRLRAPARRPARQAVESRPRRLASAGWQATLRPQVPQAELGRGIPPSLPGQGRRAPASTAHRKGCVNGRRRTG